MVLMLVIEMLMVLLVVEVKLIFKIGQFSGCINPMQLALFKLLIKPIISPPMKEMRGFVLQQMVLLVMKDHYLTKKQEFLV